MVGLCSEELGGNGLHRVRLPVPGPHRLSVELSLHGTRTGAHDRITLPKIIFVSVVVEPVVIKAVESSLAGAVVAAEPPLTTS